MDTLSKTSTFNSSLIQRVAESIENHQLITSDRPIIVGLSGGPDSIFLLHTLAQLQSKYSYTLIAAHLDHEWRSNSADDVLFCKQFAESLNVNFVSKRASEILPTKKLTSSKEEMGRVLRRTFFELLQKEYTAQTIALGHHNDDQHETFFIRLLRGAGVSGLSGIKLRDGNYIHPLLCCTKQEIITELEKNNCTYLVDPTNHVNLFLRNRIRNTIIPALKQCDDRFESSLNRTLDRLAEADDFITSHTQKIYTTIAPNNTLNYTLLFEQHPYIQKQIVLKWLIASHVTFTPSNALFSEILRFLINKKSKSHTLYHHWCITKKGSNATITFCT